LPLCVLSFELPGTIALPAPVASHRHQAMNAAAATSVTRPYAKPPCGPPSRNGDSAHANARGPRQPRASARSL
jgi:hypothetical protein